MKKKKSRNSPLRIAVLILCAGVFIFAGIKAGKIIMEYKTASDFYDDFTGDVKQVEVPEVSDADLVIAPFTVDFQPYIEMNEDFFGWIYLEDSLINYPVVKSKTNTDYLERLLNHKKNKSGTIFMDLQNDTDLSDGNTIIYGHNMNNGTMFAGLRKYMDPDYYDTHRVFWLLTPEKPYRLDVISAYLTNKYSDAYSLYNEEGSLLPYLQYTVSESAFISDVDVNTAEHVVTLSTCTYEQKAGRYVVICKVVPAVYAEDAEVMLTPNMPGQPQK